MRLVGLDIGTTTICGCAVEADTGELLSVVTRPNASRVPGTQPWEALQDPHIIMDTVREILDGFLGTWRDIAGIGVAGQMHGILYVDQDGTAVSPLHTWQDGRGDIVDDRGISTAALLSRSLGTRVSTGYGIVTHSWNAAHGRVTGTAASLCTIPDYVAMRLCGRRSPLMDASNAASIGGFDLAQGDFRRGEMDSLGIDARLFPEVTHSFPTLGEARPGVPVFVAAGDNQASFLGSVRDARATVLFNVGTGSQVSVPIHTAAEIPGMDVRPFPFSGYLAVGAALCGGRAYAILRGFFERTLRMFAPGEPSVSWDVMNLATGTGSSGGHPFQRHARRSVDPGQHFRHRCGHLHTGKPGRRGSGRDCSRADRLLPGSAVATKGAGLVDDRLRQRAADESRPAGCVRAEARDEDAGAGPRGGDLVRRRAHRGGSKRRASGPRGRGQPRPVCMNRSPGNLSSARGG